MNEDCNLEQISQFPLLYSELKFSPIFNFAYLPTYINRLIKCLQLWATLSFKHVAASRKFSQLNLQFLLQIVVQTI